MADNNKESIESEASSFARQSTRWTLGILGTLLLGAIGSGIWETLFRPGLQQVGSFITRVSQQADAAVFTSAALDPTPVPGLLLLMLLTLIPLFAGAWMLSMGFFMPWFSSKAGGWYRGIVRSGSREQVRRKLLWRLRILAILGFLLSLLMCGLLYSGFQVANEAVLVWRVFHRNLAISAPHVTESDRRALVAQFRAMESRSDFRALTAKMDGLLAMKSVKLQWYDRP